MEKKFKLLRKRDKEASQRNLSGHRDNTLKNGTVPFITGRLVTLRNIVFRPARVFFSSLLLEIDLQTFKVIHIFLSPSVQKEVVCNNLS